MSQESLRLLHWAAIGVGLVCAIAALLVQAWFAFVIALVLVATSAVKLYLAATRGRRL